MEKVNRDPLFSFQKTQKLRYKMKLAALKFKRKQAEAVSTYNIILCFGRSPLGRISARHVNGLETWASSQKKNTLTTNKINANNIYLLTTYS